MNTNTKEAAAHPDAQQISDADNTARKPYYRDLLAVLDGLRMAENDYGRFTVRALVRGDWHSAVWSASQGEAYRLASLDYRALLSDKVAIYDARKAAA